MNGSKSKQFMNKTKMRQSLAESIEHWHENWENPAKARIHSGVCPCCNATRDSLSNDVQCHLCPIALYSGKEDCRNTPWYEASSAFTPYGNKAALVETRKAFQAEYAFLWDVMLDEEWWETFESNCLELSQRVKDSENDDD